MRRNGSAPIISSLDGKIRWNQGKGNIKTDNTVVAVTPSEEQGLPHDIQLAINAISELGGGVVSLRVGTYLPEDDIILPTNVTLEGETGDGTINNSGTTTINTNNQT